MKSKGINQLKDSTKKNIHRNLSEKLGNCLHIIPDYKGCGKRKPVLERRINLLEVKLKCG